MLKRKALWSIAMLTFVAGFGTTALKADVPGLNVISPHNFGAVLFNFGWSFTVNSTTFVTGLGDYDFGPIGVLQGQVGLWDSSGNLLASAYVTSSSTPIGYFAFTSIAPVALTVGDTYIVGAQGDPDYDGGVPVTVAPQISYVEDLYTSSVGPNSPLIEPTSSDGFTSTSQAGWFGGNVLLSSGAPEPGFYGVLALGLSGMVVALKRRRA